MDKKYGKNPLGNFPEFNPWDLRLNNDVHMCHENHVIITKDLPEDDAMKFSRSDTKRIAHSYMRLLDQEKGVTPPEYRILQDINRIPRSLRRVLEAQGTRVDDKSNNAGRRFVEKEEKSKNWGGKREKKQLSAIDILTDDKFILHEDARKHHNENLLKKIKLHSCEYTEDEENDNDRTESV